MKTKSSLVRTSAQNRNSDLDSDSLGSQILAAIREAIESPTPASLRRPKVDANEVRPENR